MATVGAASAGQAERGESATRPTLLLSLRDAADAQAWGQFVELYTPLIDAYCRKSGLQDADAADVAQEVMLAVARAIQKFDYDPCRGRFRSWLLTVVRSKLNNFLARRQRLPVGTGASTLEFLAGLANAAEAPDAVWDREYNRRLFQWASARVRLEVQESTWQAFWQTAVEGESGQEVAARLGLSVGAIYVAKSRVLARLKEVLATVEADPLEQGKVGR